MPAPPKVPESTAVQKSDGLAGLFATERDILAKRIADAPAMWMSIPMWGRVFRAGRKVFGLGRSGGSGR